jgi:YfiH family protein
MPSRTAITRSDSAFPKSAGAESLIDAQIDARIEDQFEQIDALFAAAGLVSGPIEKAADGRKPTPSHNQGNKSPDDLRPAAAEPIHAGNGVEWVSAAGVNRIAWLWHGFSTRLGGMSTAYAGEGEPAELNLGFTAEDTREHVLHNRELFAEAITGNSFTPIVTIRQIHSSVVVVANSSHIGQPCEGDGLMTDKPGLLLGILTADCTPVLVADRKRKAVAAFHAGWRGTVKRIVESGIERMRQEFSSQPEDLVAAIGPSIGPCCYAVGEDVLSEFTSQFAYAPELFHEVYDSDPAKQKYPTLSLTHTQRAPGDSSKGPGLHLNVAEANRRQLLDAGLKPRNISMGGGCTRCQPQLFFSHRGSQGRAGRMLSVVGIRG